jgi:spermidine synthase
VSPLSWRVAALLLGSGFCALVYQVAWQRGFQLVFGVSTAASGAVLAAFMGGLGLGALVLGPRVDRRSNPLLIYAALEAAVALLAATTPHSLELVRQTYLSLGGTASLGAWGATSVRLVLACLVLLPPTFLAGGTLGAAARAVERETDSRRRSTALLYGANTLGAVAGCLTATFWMLEAFGTRATLWIAAAINLLIALVAAGLALLSARGAAGGAHAEPDVATAQAAAPRTLVLGAAATVGFVFFLLELVWYRMLGPILGGTVYTFGLVLAVALFGIALGGAFYAAASPRVRLGLPTFAATCLLEAAAVALPYALGDRIALFALSLRPPSGALLASYLPGWTIVAAIVVLPAAFVAGAQFPLLISLLGQGRERLASHVGSAYFWNTAGAIAGALAGGFGLLPWLTAPGCWRAAVLLLVVLAVVALVGSGHRPRWALPLGIGAAASVGVTVFLAEGPTAVWRHSSIGTGRATLRLSAAPNTRQAWMNEIRRSIRWEREGVESSIAVQDLAGFSFVVNGKVDGNARSDAPTQVMGPLLGALLRPGLETSFVVGLGTGSSAGWLATVPGMRRTDVAELEPAILDVARLCAPVNRSVMDNPRVRVMTGDAREALMTSRERYDLVFSEPSNPYRAGVASLFTREFYEAAAARMSGRGVFLQWVQAYEVDDETISTLIATLAGVFPHVEIWQVHQIDLLLVASREALVYDAAALRSRMRKEPFASALLRAWRATELEDVLARFVATPALGARLRAEGQPVNTDDRNVVEFSFARSLSRFTLFDALKLRQRANAIGAGRPEIAGEVDWGRVARQRLAIHTIGGSVAPLGADASDEERARARAHAQNAAGELRAAVASFGAQPQPPEGATEAALFAEGLADAGDPRAAPYLRALHEIQPIEAEAATARLALRMGQVELARNALVSAFVHYRTDPWPDQIRMTRALALAQELAAVRPDAAPVLVEALGQPFSVNAVEGPRRLARLVIGASGGITHRCGELLEPFEPHAEWRADILRFRASCYQATRDPRASLAMAELSEYLQQEPTARGIGPRGRPSPAAP